MVDEGRDVPHWTVFPLYTEVLVGWEVLPSAPAIYDGSVSRPECGVKVDTR